MLKAYDKLQPKPKTIPALVWIWTALPQKSIAKGVKDLRKRLEVSVSARWGYFEYKMWYDITVTDKRFYLRFHEM